MLTKDQSARAVKQEKDNDGSESVVSDSYKGGDSAPSGTSQPPAKKSRYVIWYMCFAMLGINGCISLLLDRASNGNYLFNENYSRV